MSKTSCIKPTVFGRFTNRPVPPQIQIRSPQAHHMLHPEADRRYPDPAAEPGEDRLPAGPDELDDIRVQPGWQPLPITIRNLLSSFSGAVMSAGSWKTVVTTDARMKNRTKNGKERFRLNEDPFVFFSFRPLQTARMRVMGMIASVRVIFTMAALSSVLLPWIPSHAVAAAVTEEVSFTSPCPQTGRNHRCSGRAPRPEWGRSAAASTLNRKITEIDCATSSSEASMTGAVAAIALPAADRGAHPHQDRIVGFSA